MNRIVRFQFSIFKRMLSPLGLGKTPKPEPKVWPQAPKTQQPNKDPKAKQGSVQDPEVVEFSIYQRKKFLESQKDYSKLKQMFKNIPEEIGKGGIDEVLYWAEGVASPPDIVKLVEGFNKAMINTNSQIPTSFVFEEFKGKAVSIAYLCPDLATLASFSKFGRLYDIQEPEFWAKLQEKYMKKSAHEVNLDASIDTVMAFSEKKRGELIYARIEQMVTQHTDSLNVDQICNLIYSYYTASKGTEAFVAFLAKLLEENVANAEKRKLALVAPLLPDMKLKKSTTLFQAVEKRALQLFGEMNLEELCRLGRGFGYHRGSELFWDELEKNVQKQLPTISSAQEIQSVIQGLLTSYRVSTKFVNQARALIQSNYLAQISPACLSQLAKALHVYEIKCKPLQVRIQGLIIENLRDVSQISVDDLVEIAKNYCVTRHGTRDIYKMLEVVISAKIPAIRQDRNAVEALIVIYKNSDLCSIDFLKALISLK